jgi:hypothetical protein
MARFGLSAGAIMRLTTLLAATSVAVVMTASAAPPPGNEADPGAAQALSPWPYANQSLNSPDALERLRQSNPRHYAIARRILAAANQICDAGEAGLIPTQYDAQQLSCSRGMWLASNPPKRQLTFRIENTVYTALIAVRVSGAKLKPAGP